MRQARGLRASRRGNHARRWSACAALALACLLALPSGRAQTTGLQAGLHYVTDQLSLEVRASPSADGASVESVTSGEALVVIESNDSGYAKVRLDDGTEGWVPSRYLVLDPPPSRRLDELGEELSILRIEKEQLSGRVDALQLDKNDLGAALDKAKEAQSRLEAELGQARKAAAEATASAASGPGPRLEAQVKDLEEQVRLLHIRNRELRSNVEQRWFVAGGSLAVICVLLGIFAARLTLRRRSSW